MQLLHELAADVARRARDENSFHGLLLSTLMDSDLVDACCCPTALPGRHDIGSPLAR
jgi:hypothetical protein